MKQTDWLTDDLIEGAFERRAGQAVPVDLRVEIVTLTSVTEQRASWRLRLATAWSAPVLRPAWVALLVLGILLGAALALELAGARLTPDLLTQQADTDVDSTPQESQGSQRAQPGILAYTQDGDVYMANPDGSSATMVVHDDGVDFSALTWSPDAQWLALQGGERVFLLDPATLKLRHVADGRGAVWSSDSQSLALVSSSTTEAGPIKIVEIQTGAVHELRPRLGSDTSLDAPLAWSPDGRWFLAPTQAATGKRFVRIDAATGDVVDIAPMYHLADPGAHWSPDARRFAYARPDDCGGNPPCQSSIVIGDADLTNAVAITDPTRLAWGPVWSPDGAWIAFGSAMLLRSSQDSGPGPTVGEPTLSIVRPDGLDLRNIASGDLPAFSWSADGGAIDVYEIDRATGLGLGVFEVRITDGARRTVAEAPNSGGYDWQSIPEELPVPTVPARP